MFILLLLLVPLTALIAEDKTAYQTYRNEVRIGWGDQLFESAVWHNPTHIINTMPLDYRQTYHENYSNDQHLWVEYQWRFTHWFSLGGMADLSNTRWDDVVRNGAGEEVSRSKNHFFYNLVFMPTVRFTYLHHPYVNLYSGLGMGVNINGGTETGIYGTKTEAGIAMNVTLIGLSANYKRWFAAVDFGGLYAFRNANVVYMLSSRIMNVSIGARF